LDTSHGHPPPVKTGHQVSASAELIPGTREEGFAERDAVGLRDYISIDQHRSAEAIMADQTITAAQTLALLQRYYAAFNAGDTETMTALVADDLAHDTNQGERRMGRDRFKAFNGRMAHHYKEQLDGITILVSPDGTRAAAEFNVTGQYLVTETGLPDANGQTYKLPAGTFFAIKAGSQGPEIARITTYYNLTEWIMQVSV
jgi:steroid delta-isomerase-like uncharacterized protein